MPPFVFNDKDTVDSNVPEEPNFEKKAAKPELHVRTEKNTNTEFETDQVS